MELKKDIKTKQFEKSIYNNNYIKLLWPDILFIIIFIWIQIFGNIVTTISYILLCIYAMKNSKSAIKSLALGVILTFSNTSLFPGSSYGYLLKWVLMFCAAGRVYFTYLFSYKKTIPKWFIYLFIFSIFSAIFSLMNSYSISVSLSTQLVFFIGISTIFLGFEQSTDISWSSWFFTLFTAMIVSSLPLLTMPQGYFRNSQGFQGILNHPQAYGVYIIIPTLWLTIIWFTSKKMSFFMQLLILCGWITVFASRTRTALFAVILTVLFNIIISFKRRKFLKNLSPNILKSLQKPATLILISIIIIILVLYGNVIHKEIGKFIFKGTYFSKYLEQKSFYPSYNVYNESRGTLIKNSWENFIKHPWTGIGFGIGSVESNFAVKKSTIYGIPLSAPTEKGFIFTALLEEVGIFGTLLFLLFLFKLIKPIIEFGDLASVTLLGVAFFVTFGEMVFFSAGGFGICIWLWMALAKNSVLITENK